MYKKSLWFMIIPVIVMIVSLFELNGLYRIFDEFEVYCNAVLEDDTAYETLSCFWSSVVLGEMEKIWAISVLCYSVLLPLLINVLEEIKIRHALYMVLINIICMVIPIIYLNSIYYGLILPISPARDLDRQLAIVLGIILILISSLILLLENIFIIRHKKRNSI